MKTSPLGLTSASSVTSPDAPGDDTGSGGMMKRAASFSPAGFGISAAEARSAACAQPLPKAVLTSTQSPFRERIETASLA